MTAPVGIVRVFPLIGVSPAHPGWTQTLRCRPQPWSIAQDCYTFLTISRKGSGQADQVSLDSRALKR